MEPFQKQLSETDSPILATDLDGTLIPLQDNPQNQRDLETLASEVKRSGILLIYSTGRHFDSATRAIEQFGLPLPDWLVCDVGTSIFKRGSSGGYTAVKRYQEHQDQIIASFPIQDLRQRLESMEGLRLQEPEKQGRFKLSFYTTAEQLPALVGDLQQRLDQLQAPYAIIHSVDPFNGDGLIDLLPANVSKAHALAWWVEQVGLRREAIVFAGDSGNDLAVLTAGYRAIIVGNADRSIARKATEAHRKSGWKTRLYLARGHATSGVLQGCRWYGIIAPNVQAEHR